MSILCLSVCLSVSRSTFERKRRTLEEPDTAAARAKDEINRVRYRGVRELRNSARSRTGGEDVAFWTKSIVTIDSVTSVDTRGNQRGFGKRGVFAGLNVAIRGIWKWAVSRTSGGTPWGAKRKKDRRGEG